MLMVAVKRKLFANAAAPCARPFAWMTMPLTTEKGNYLLFQQPMEAWVPVARELEERNVEIIA